MSENTLLQISNLNKHFDGVAALNDFSLELQKSEIVGLIGPNGAGKSTLFNVTTGFLRPETGNVLYKKENINALKPHKIAKLGIGRTFQDLRLITQAKVIDNLLLTFKQQPGEKINNIFFNTEKTNRIERNNRERAIELLKLAGIDHKANDLTGDLSYGQQKLLSVICCLAMDSKILLLDEPIAGINPALIERILKIIAKLPEQGKSVILIEHDMKVINDICDRVVFMDAGKKVSEGTPQEVRDDPIVINSYLD